MSIPDSEGDTQVVTQGEDLAAHLRGLADATDAARSGITRVPWKTQTHLGCKSIGGAKQGRHKQGQYRDIAFTTGLSKEEEDIANACFIVYSANSAAAIVSALRAAADRLEQAARPCAVCNKCASCCRSCEFCAESVRGAGPAYAQDTRATSHEDRANDQGQR